MEDYTLIGNSISREVQPEGFRSTICRPGAPFRSLLRVAEKTPGVCVILCGIPDICFKFQQHIDPRKTNNFRSEIERYSESKSSGVILPFYPPAYLSPVHYNTIQGINDQIKIVNRQRGEYTPNVLDPIFKPPNNRLNTDALTDGVHPRRWYARELEQELERWMSRRETHKRRRKEQQQVRESIQTERKRQTEVDELRDLEKKRQKIDEEIKARKINLKYDALRAAAKRKYEQEVQRIEEERASDLAATSDANSDHQNQHYPSADLLINFDPSPPMASSSRDIDEPRPTLLDHHDADSLLLGD